MFVYCVTNRVNGKKYVGQHVGDDLQKYWDKRHVQLALLGYYNHLALHRAICKYGPDSFVVEPLAVLDRKEWIDFYEILFIGILQTQNKNIGYNLTEGGEGVSGLTKEQLEKRNKNISESLKGNQNCLGRIESEETRRKKSEVNMGNQNAVGTVRTPEYCRQKSESQIGRKFSDETRLRMSLAAKNRRAREKEIRDGLVSKS